MANDLQIVGFSVGKEHFGVPISSVHEIVRAMEVTAVPDSPSYVEGVINLRGKIIPVIDLRKRFGEKSIAPHKKNRIVIAEVGGRMVGLMVDSASEVLRIPAGDVEPPPDVFSEGELNYVNGMAKTNNRLIILIDLARIMQAGELRRLGDLANSAGAA